MKMGTAVDEDDDDASSVAVSDSPLAAAELHNRRFYLSKYLSMSMGL